MELKIGKRYVTRNGVVTPPITAVKHTNYAFEAWIKEPEFVGLSWRQWLNNGCYLTASHEHKLDLVKEFEPLQ